MWWKYLKYVAYYTCKVFLYTSISKIFIVTYRNKYHVSHVQAAGRSLPTVGVLLVFHLLPIMLVVVCVRLPDTLLRLSRTRRSSKRAIWARKRCRGSVKIWWSLGLEVGLRWMSLLPFLTAHVWLILCRLRRLPLRRLRMVFRLGYGTCIRLPSCDKHQARIFLEGASMVSKE